VRRLAAVHLLALALLGWASGCAHIFSADSRTDCADRQPEGTHLSNTDSAYCSLEELQRIEVDATGLRPSTAQDVREYCHDNPLCATIAATADERLPTRYEDAFFYPVARDLNLLVADAAQSVVGRTVAPQRIGTLASRNIQAEIITDGPSKTPVIVVNTYLLLFCDILQKIALETLAVNRAGDHIEIESKSKDELAEELRRHRLPVEHFAMAVEAFHRNLLPPHFELPPEKLALQELLEGIELFVIGHEYGHIVMESRGLDRAVHPWVRELQADCLGVRFLSAAAGLRPVSRHFSISSPSREYVKTGALFYLAMIDMLSMTEHRAYRTPYDSSDWSVDVVDNLAADLRANNCAISAAATRLLTDAAPPEAGATHPPPRLRAVVVDLELRKLLQPRDQRDKDLIALSTQLIHNLGTITRVTIEWARPASPESSGFRK
jgi:hypothetical protein